MKPFLFSLSGMLCLAAMTASAQEETLLKQLGRDEMLPAVRQAIGVRVKVNADDKGAPILVIENPESSAKKVFLLEIPQPPITAQLYAVTGQVRYENVSGPAFLEMWSHFGTGAYFSRTLGSVGPMAALSGTSNWRGFSLPFDASGLESNSGQVERDKAKTIPDKLVINLQLPGSGHVEIRNLRLVQWSIIPGHQAWWSDRAAGLIGGIAGAIIGILGGTVEFMAARGRGRSWVMAMVWALIAIGAVALIAGVAALSLRQPYAVWYPLLLMGVICTAIFATRARKYRHRYNDLELRRMSSMDLAAP